MMKRLIPALVALLITAALGAGLAMPVSAAAKPEIPYDDDVPLVPYTDPVIILQGSDYEMGRQYAEQLYQILGPWYLNKLQRTFSKAELAALRAYQWHIKINAPEFIDEIKGLAAGARARGITLSYAQVLAECCSSLGMGGSGQLTLPTYPGTEPPESKNDKLPPSCSGFVAWGSATKDGKLVAAGSGDTFSATFFWRVMVIPKTGNSYIYTSIGLSSDTCHPGMNNKGLAYAHHGAGNAGNEKRGYGVPRCLMIQHTLRYANTCAEALALQMSYPTQTGGLWADTGGHAFDLECRNPQTVRRAGDCGENDFLYASNSVLATSLKPFLQNRFGWPLNYFPHGGWNLDDMNSVRRDLHMWNCLHNYHGSVDLDFAKMMFRMPAPEPAYPSLEEAEAQLYATHGKGWDTYIGSLSNGVIAVMQPDNGNSGKYYSAGNGSPGRRVGPFTAHYYKFEIAPTYAYYELQLAADPAAIVSAARARSQYDLYYANRELRKLTYADTSYAALDALFNKAATESQKGDYYVGRAATATGNAQVCDYGKAVRAFTRCQAFAKQVYESLVPPADTPGALPGLETRPWFGDWTDEWVTAPDGDDSSGNP